VGGVIAILLICLAFADSFYIATLTDGKMDCADLDGKFDLRTATWVLDLLVLIGLIAASQLAMWLAVRKLPVKKEPSS
jgi:hypothetical protein